VLCDNRAHTGNATTAARLCAVLAEAGVVCAVSDVGAEPPPALPASCALLVAIHAGKAGAAALARAAAAPSPSPALVVVLSGTDLNGDAGARAASLRACARARAVVALSPGLAARYEAARAAAAPSPPAAPPPRCVYVPQAACTDAEVAAARARARAGDLRAACGLPADAHVALLVAGVRAVKAPGFLLPAFLGQRCAPALAVHLVLVGPVLDAALMSALRLAGLRDAPAGAGALAQYLPPVPRPALLSWLAQASAVVNCSESEGQSCALLEAMAVAGAVVVARRIEGNEALVAHGATGLLFDSPDQALAACRHACGLERLPGVDADAPALRAAAAAHVARAHSQAAEAAAWAAVAAGAMQAEAAAAAAAAAARR
jgi:hypothetical protein